ncbi:hypothetical protein ACSYAY_01780 [Leptospirillum ferriphilum]|uniref:hypothetical protein n=1 Tax=Leptospirillum ferriphilum TaxID=178606 RepID=UPI003EE7F6B1
MLEGIGQTFSWEMHQQRKVLRREIREKEDRIRKLGSVVSGLSTENLMLKKHRGPLSGTHLCIVLKYEKSALEKVRMNCRQKQILLRQETRSA